MDQEEDTLQNKEEQPVAEQNQREKQQEGEQGVEEEEEIEVEQLEMTQNPQQKKKCRCIKKVDHILSKQNKKTHWGLASKRASPELLQIFFSNIQLEQVVQVIRLDWNYLPNIITVIQPPIFTCLRILSLGGNNIETLHPIIRLHAKFLRQLLLWNNKITNLNSLRKANFPALRHIDLSNNKLVSVGRLWELGVGELKRVDLDYNNISSLNEMSKMKNFSLQGRMNICGNNFIIVFGVSICRGFQRAHVCHFRDTIQPEIWYS